MPPLCERLNLKLFLVAPDGESFCGESDRLSLLAFKTTVESRSAAEFIVAAREAAAAPFFLGDFLERAFWESRMRDGILTG